jgi:hypothetical protein
MSEDHKWMQDFPVANLDHAKREIVAARFYEISVDAVDQVARNKGALR